MYKPQTIRLQKGKVKEVIVYSLIAITILLVCGAIGGSTFPY